MSRNKLIGAVLAGAMALAVGFEGTRYAAYQDVGGVWTICQGETLGVKKGDKSTPEQCDNMLIKGLLRHNTPFEKLPHELPDNIHMATLDFCYNVGAGACTRSTLWKYLEAGKYSQACNEFTKWKYVAGKDCSKAGSNCGGVWTRRLIERDLCSGELTIEQAAAKLGQVLKSPDGATQ